MQKLWPRWPLPVVAALLAAGPSLASEKLSPLPQNVVQQLRSRETSRAEAAIARLRSQRHQLGLGQQDDFKLRNVVTDRFGQTHARFEQLHQGVKVWGAMAIAHTDGNGKDLPVTDALRKGIRLDVRPTLDAAAALEAAKRELAPKGRFNVAPTTELIVYPQTVRHNTASHKPARQVNAVDMVEEVVGYKLAYHVHTELENETDGIRHTDYIVDARSGEILKQWNSLQTDAAAVGTGNSQYSGTVQLNAVRKTDGSYILQDTTRGVGSGNYTTNSNRAAVQSGAADPKLDYVDADNVWGNGEQANATGPTDDANGQTAAVDAHYGLQMTWDYYLKLHERLGIDGLGTATYNRVHVGTAYNNAFWSDSCYCMSYGDGSGGANGFTQMAALDVSAHEMSHGVMSRTAGLIYAGESGGLNESNSDIFGAMVEFWVRDGQGNTIGNTAGNWLIGEDLNPFPLRIMYKPSWDGASADAWFPGIENIDVHYSSGPMNRAFFFLSQGAKAVGFEAEDPRASTYLPHGMMGIGNDKAAAIWYRAVTTYLYPSANYVAARTATLQSARDLFGADSAEYGAVQNAFAAVNVGYSASTYDDLVAPTASVSVSGTGSPLLLQATATDNVGVTRVEFVVDGGRVATDYTLPFEYSLDVTQLDNGPHEVSVLVYDLAGNVAGSAPQAFTVTNSFSQLLGNAGFEANESGEPWVLNPPGNLNIPSSSAHRGVGFVYLNDWGTVHDDTLYQDVTIPASALTASLSFYLNINTAETAVTAIDTLTVEVRDAAGATLRTLKNWSNLDVSNGYVQRSFDLSEFKGQPVRIHLRGLEDAARGTGFRLDSFALRTTSAADTEQPTVAARSVVAGTTLVLFADVNDNGHVAQVEFLLDGVVVGTATDSFTASVDLASLTNGAHTLVARATDAAGNVGSSAPRSIVVDTSRVQRVQNPGFEDNTAAGAALWPVTTNVPGSTRIFTNSGFVHSGSRFMISFTNLGPHTSSTYQTVTIPAASTSAIYSFWLRIFSNAFSDGLVHHTGTATVRDSSGALLSTLATYSNLDDTGGAYIERRFDLSAYKGQTVRVSFEYDMQTPAQLSGGVSQFFLDDVTLITSDVADTLAPTVGAAVLGSYGTVSLRGTASDNVWVSKLEFLVDDVLVQTVNNPAASVSVAHDMSGTAKNGAHVLKVRATDVAGNTSESSATFTIANSTVVDEYDPAVLVGVTGANENLAYVAETDDDTGVVRMEFYVDGILAGVSTAAPFTLAADIGHLVAGEHVLRAVAYDAYGHNGIGETTFQFSPVSVSIAPTHVAMLPGATLALEASVGSASNTSVTWSIVGESCGSISAAGLYTAPAAAARCQIVATSNADASKRDVVRVGVYTGDLNGDGHVDGDDLGLMAEAYGTASAAADFDYSNSVDDTDITLLTAQFGR